jgi:lipopolysaccharide export system protein LptC
MTIDVSRGSAKALERAVRRDLAAVWPRQRQFDVLARARRAVDRHSRCVTWLKRFLPVIGGMMLVLVALWPRLGPLLENAGLGLRTIDLREARELRMLNPRYAGIDRFDRPYVVTAAVGRQVPNRDDLMSLEGPRAEMTMHGGAIVVLTAATAIYQSQAQRLDLSDQVTLIHENGTRFVTKSAHADVSANTADGQDPVTGDGPSGNIAAQGFRILDKGDTIIFTGKSYLLLKGAKPTAPKAAPPTLPSEIEAAAARIEAAAVASPVANGSWIQDGLIVEPVRSAAPERVSPAEAGRR